MYERRELPTKNERLPPPYPVALSPIKSNFGFYCYRDDGGFCFHNFHSRYAAHHFIKMITEGREYKWTSNDAIILDNGTRIRGEREDDLEKAIDYDPIGEEREWEPTEPNVSYIRAFLGQARITFERNESTGTVERTDDNPKRERTRAPMPEQEKVARRKAKARSGEYITIAQICQDLGHEPRVCRALLRKLKVPKPDHGWSWPPSDADQIKARLKKLLK